MEAAVYPEDRYYTVEEWLALEDELDTKFEYLNGYLYDVRAMAGGTIPHGRACMNVSGALREAVRSKGGSCFTYNSEVKLYIARHQRYYYPDASVRCGEEKPGEETGSYRNPTVVVEVVSESSYKRDTGTKFRHYRALPSLRDYVLVFLDEAAVAVYSRTSPQENMRVAYYYGLDAVAELPSLGIALAMRELYEAVELPPAAAVVSHPGKREDGA